MFLENLKNEKRHNFNAKDSTDIIRVFICIILSEMLLRATGFYFVKEKKHNLIQKDPNLYKIVCIGDSSTFGLGAENRQIYNYPNQLQQLLDESISNKKFQVINLGVPGANSSQVVHRLRNNILEYKPDLVIIMIGMNDIWNLKESNIIQYYYNNKFDKMRFNVEVWLSKFRVYQLFKLVIFGGVNLPALDTSLFLSDKEIIALGSNDHVNRGEIMLRSYDSFKNNKLYEAMEHNIHEMYIMLLESGVEVIFMKYHVETLGQLEKTLYSTYEKLSVPVVDNPTIFRRAKEKGFNALSTDGWHPNDFGYTLIAKNIYNKMINLRIIDSEPVEIIKE